ncbi:uncharacterized protein LOC130766554 [Actinidia eriantha]|uniref:uncharacterized protein LOC130766554 n=1 Tax=Actinidia eriantha TaxID=165200 RepID=UPI00258A4DA4|nr:uncharacterized protein LOC130766554 [Actinidia eriantha]
MDFHSLARRELQALCKKNKIPANLTNIAMADALKALEIVEGIEDFSKPCESETAESSVELPEKTVIASPFIPRTGYRTSTWRKPVKEEPESSKIMTRTRLSSRRTISGEVQNAKPDGPETPAMPSGRKRAPVASARRKIEAQLNEEDEDKNNAVASAHRKMETPMREEISVQKAYSTRRSTRLLEKKMMELDLNNKEGIEPVHFEASEEMPKDLERNQKEKSDEFDKVLEVKGMYQQMINAKNDDLEPVSDEISKDLERNVKEDSDDLDKSLEVKGTNQQIIADDLLLKTDDLEAITHETDMLSENVSNLEDDVQECMEDNNEVDKVKPQKNSEVFCEADTVLVSDGQADGLIIHKDKDVNDEVYGENKDDEKSQINSGMDCEKYGESDILSGENLEKSLGLKDEIPEEKGCDEYGFDSFRYGIENTSECLMSESGEGFNGDKNLGLKDLAAVLSYGGVCGENTTECLKSESGEGFNGGKDLVLQDLVVPVVEDLATDSEKTESDILARSASAAADIEPQNQASKESDMNFVNDQNNVRVLELDLDTKELSHEKAPCPVITTLASTTSIAMEVAIDASVENDTVDQLAGQESTIFGNLIASANSSTIFYPSLDKTLRPLIGTLAADPLPVQMPSILLQGGLNSDHVTCPASPTSVKNSSSKTTTTTTRGINNLLVDNKENNIDNSSRKLDLTKEKEKTDKKLFNDDTSLRQLRKIFKEKLQITNNREINEEKNNAKVERSRPALQTVSENRLASSETKKEN